MSERIIIGVCCCGTGEEYQDKICNGLIEYAAELGNVKLIFYTSFLNSNENPSYSSGELNVYNLIDYSKIDGMIILGLTIKDSSVTQRLISNCKKNGVRVVCYDYETQNCSYVSHDSFKAVYELTSHLIEKHGCKKINFMGGGKRDILSLARENAYMKALTNHKLPADKRRVGEGFWWTHTAETACVKWLDEGMEFDAVVCANDLMAISVIRVLNERGLRVPEDVKVVGIDNLREGSYFDPVLTTADFCHRNGVRQAMEIVLGEKSEGKYQYDLSVLYKSSCGCGCDEPIDTNAFHREMYDKVDMVNADNEELYNLVSRMIEQPEAEQSFACLDLYLQQLWTSKIWVCINTDLIERNADLTQELDAVINLPKHYSKYVEVIAAKDGGAGDRGKIIKSVDLCPDIDKQFDEYTAIMVFPLHINDNILGYVVKEHSANFIMNKWYSMAMNLSTALLSVKQTNDVRIANKRLEEMYIRDSMTNIFNRRGFFQHLKRYMMTSKNKTMVVISVDLDGLKNINDGYGHIEGDNAITVTAKAIMKAAGDEFICARFGGDEFIAAGPYAEEDNFEERFTLLLCKYNETSQKPYNISASVGCVVEECRSFKDFDRLIKLADERMYCSKMNANSGICRERPRTDFK